MHNLTQSLKFVILTGLSANLFAAANEPLPFAEAQITQVVNDVAILQGADLEKSIAQVDQKFQAPDILETGRRSRAELIAEDGTITRVGSNTLFSFEPAKREINLKKGSVLFHSPTGMGGGQIVTDAATASVIGTTIIVAATTDGGFKILCLEGRARVTFANGTESFLEAGQLTFVLPRNADQTGSPSTNASAEGGEPGPVLNFDLKKMGSGSNLLSGFSHELPSQQKINTETELQQEKINNGSLGETDAVILGANGKDKLILANGVVVEEAIQVSKDLQQLANRNSAIAQALSQNVLYGANSELSTTNIFNRAVKPSIEQSPYLGAESPFGNTYRGLVAKNIGFDTTSFDLSLLGLDDSDNRVDIAASEDIYFFENSIQFVVPEEVESLRLTAQNIHFEDGSPMDQSNNSSGSVSGVVSGIDMVFSDLIDTTAAIPYQSYYQSSISISADSFVRLAIESLNTIEAEYGYIENSHGPIDFLVREGDIILEHFDINAGSYSDYIYDSTETLPKRNDAPTDISITTPGTLDLLYGSISAQNSIIHLGELAATDNAPTPKQILLEGTNLYASGLKVLATDLISANNIYIGDMMNVRMSAATINLTDINFAYGSDIELSSLEGLLNVGSSVFGHVNFISNVTYGYEPAENYVSPSSLAEGVTHEFIESRIKISTIK